MNVVPRPSPITGRVVVISLDLRYCDKIMSTYMGRIHGGSPKTIHALLLIIQ